MSTEWKSAPAEAADKSLPGLPGCLLQKKPKKKNPSPSYAVTAALLHSAWLMMSCGAQREGLVSIMRTAAAAVHCADASYSADDAEKSAIFPIRVDSFITRLLASLGSPCLICPGLIQPPTTGDASISRCCVKRLYSQSNKQSNATAVVFFFLPIC